MAYNTRDLEHSLRRYWHHSTRWIHNAIGVEQHATEMAANEQAKNENRVLQLPVRVKEQFPFSEHPLISRQ
jgi:hypothetical protein